MLDTAKYRGKIMLTGLATPDEMKKYVADGTVKKFALWNPADLGYLAAYAAVELASHAITNASGQSFTAGKLGKFTVGPGAHCPARPTVRVRQGQHQQVQLLVVPPGGAGFRKPAPHLHKGREPATRTEDLGCKGSAFTSVSGPTASTSTAGGIWPLARDARCAPGNRLAQLFLVPR